MISLVSFLKFEDWMNMMKNMMKMMNLHHVFLESFTFQLKNIRINKFILCVMQHHRFFNKKLNKEVICSCL
jgi:hypothetical protein